jgi:hypothetical protein
MELPDLVEAMTTRLNDIIRKADIRRAQSWQRLETGRSYLAMLPPSE